MATKRKRTSKSNTTVATAAASAADVAKPGASGRVTPRKRTDVPVKAKVRAGSVPRAIEVDETAPKKAAATSAENAHEERRRQRRQQRAEAKQRKPRKLHWPLIVVSSVLLVVLLAVGAFSWDRWLRYDDALEFQGEWQTHGTTAIVVIDGETIKLTEDVGWTYSLDTGAKTIAFTFGNMEGSGRYRFSLDRSQLVITDGEGYSWFSTLTEDIAWQFDHMVRAIQGRSQEEPPSGDAYTVLDRLSHDAAATPQTGTPVQPEPEAVVESEAVVTAEPEPEAATTPEAESKPEAETTSESAGKNNGAGASSTPSGVFDVSDLPA